MTLSEDYLLYKIATAQKIVVINRGLPGSGKSTFIRHLQKVVGPVKVHSTDNYFYGPDGVYHFDPSKLGEYHTLNLKHFIEDLDKGTRFVINDNTNLAPWESAEYVKAAKARGYKVIFVNFHPHPLDFHLAHNVHGVPEDVLRHMLDKWYKGHELLVKSPEAFGADTVLHVKDFSDIPKVIKSLRAFV